MSKRANLPYTYQDLFPQATLSPRDFRTPGSVSGVSFTETVRNGSIAFTPARNAGSASESRIANWKTMFKRLFKPRTLDFETAIWEIFHLIVNPKKMYRSNYMYKQQNNGKTTYTRDDPSFLILVTAFLCISAIAWGATYSPNVWDIIKLVINMVVFDFYVLGVFIATLLWAISNKLFNPQFRLLQAFSAASHYSVNYIDWGFCFDVHCNSFLIIWCMLYLLQFFLLPVLTIKTSFLSLLLGNTLYFTAIGYYFVVTFYGFNSLPFVGTTHYNRNLTGTNPGKILQLTILAGIMPLLAFLWLLSVVFRFNVAYTMVDNYFN
ncbi:CIC11C00000001597 [Sungouiella intermedia]|uniref:CIC11C00000001597 n=1 Tax=Sungouiella intermedia TaxID=45354 RepID=A0A1L0BRK5_9ASCO|nr:CIC11C00000001597 [[Candida] intermedia]